MISSIPHAIVSDVEERMNCKVKSFSVCIGGCINHGGKITTSAGEFFLKWNDATKLPGMFEAEARGLNILEQVNAIKVPRIIHTATVGPDQYLLMEFIHEGLKSSSYWETFGHQLAQLHKHSNISFGLDHDNYIGSLPQYNKRTQDYVTFLIEQRFIPQLTIAKNNNALPSSAINLFSVLFKKLPEIIPIELPSLIHGDLWSGNLITSHAGDPCLIDPACHYGHRESEIAFTQLFGGFAAKFYSAYQESFPLQQGFEQRVNLYNLYPLLVHVNLFGGSYSNQLVTILKSVA